MQQPEPMPTWAAWMIVVYAGIGIVFSSYLMTDFFLQARKEGLNTACEKNLGMPYGTDWGMSIPGFFMLFMMFATFWPFMMLAMTNKTSPGPTD